MILQKLNKLKQLETTVGELKEKDNNLQMEIDEYIKNSSESEEDARRRADIQDELVSLEKEREKLQSEVNRYKDCDPDSMNQMETECKVAREAIDRWTGMFFSNLSVQFASILISHLATENVFAVKSWCKKKFNMDDAEIRKNLQIPADFDYFEG